MTSAPRIRLADDAARRTAIAARDRSFLVEAGAGSGKTAVMAGRIAMMLAEGTEPKRIAAVTFTEFAASELLIRVREFVGELAAGRIPAELRAALPDGLSEDRRRRLAAAVEAIDEMTCSTIHGFCQRLIGAYPVEADIDPGAAVMDGDQANLAFDEIADTWLREELAGETGGLLAKLILKDPGKTVQWIRSILSHLRGRHVLVDDVTEDPAPLAAAFRRAVDDFTAFVRDAGAKEAETAAIADRFAELAEEIAFARTGGTDDELVRLFFASPHPDLCTGSGRFRNYQKKGKWNAAARRAGLARADGARLNDLAAARYAACRETWEALQRAAAARILADVVRLLQPVTGRFRDYKRSAALLDFDDLIFAARALLRDHEEVRRALAARFAHVLVDEFQDTDPLQTEIFWRLCGDPPDGAEADDWTSFQIRPGALFLVGDPKQAIYRFRGADIAAYLRAREAFLAQAADSVLSISTNFRSCAPIMHYVNRCFAEPLSVENGQPGFNALDAFQPERAGGPSVAALDIAVADDDGKASTDQQRDGEANAVADLCARLIGSAVVRDHKSGKPRVCEAGDIALLAPAGTDLWRYEEALERLGIPVATQAGKGLFRRQEIQDLIAVTRVLADQRDTLALGALLRGPLVGLTEEELLDVVWALPRPEDAPGTLQRLDLRVDPEDITHPHARDIIEKLQALRRSVNAVTPHELLSRAVDVLRVRPVLWQRHRGQAERTLANVDLYLSFSRAYAVRGLRAFAEAMNAAWTDGSRTVEGRPDAQEDAVTLYTMHAAKGLEWPIVVPINTMTQIRTPESAVIDRASGRFYCPVFGVPPSGYEAARDAEGVELARERVRLWYVTATRARELLILPRLDVGARKSTWNSCVELSLADLPALDLDRFPLGAGAGAAAAQNEQTRERFAAEAAAIVERHRCIVWRTPSRDEGAAGPVLQAMTPAVLVTDADGAPADNGMTAAIQGGRERGLVLHKLIEEVLTGETAETVPDLRARAETLIRALGRTAARDPARGLAPSELAGCVIRTLSLPQIAALRPGLTPEFPVYAATSTDTHEEAAAGIADAVAFDAHGAPQVVVDWKSDVNLTPEALEHYGSQVRAYLDMTGAERGLIVAVTSGTVIPVAQTGPAAAES